MLLALSPLMTENSHAQNPNQNNELFIANTKEECGNIAQCFYNDDPDTLEALALQKAINFVKTNNLSNPNINILNAYSTKTATVTIDYPLTLTSQSNGYLSTSSSNCSNPLLKVTSNVNIRNLTITDGSCSSPSRDLVVVESSANVIIEKSTLEFGRNAIVHKNSTGNLTVRFNQIKNNDGYALLSENTEITSRLTIVANNITNNGQIQVVCQNNRSVDHNFWGDSVMPSQTAPSCGVDNNRRLDVPIVLASNGVQAEIVNSGSSYPSSPTLGVSAKSNSGAQIYIVNHGESKPFPDMAIGEQMVCARYYDIFLEDGSQATDLSLRFSYSGNNLCEQAIESASLCGSGQKGTYPLMWLDVKTGVTDGWDNAGDSPKGPGGDIYSGQEVRCNSSDNTIEIDLNDLGRPNLSNDLNFTPIALALETTAVNALKSSQNTSNSLTLSWTTISELNTMGFRLMRSTSPDGPWEQIGELIPAAGSASSGKTYSIEDNTVSPNTTYYYQLQILNSDGSLQHTLAPLRVDVKLIGTNTPRPTSTRRPTSTKIPTRTPTAFRTATNAYRTATSEYFPGIPTSTLSPEELLETETPTLANGDFLTPENPGEFAGPEFATPTNKGNLLDKIDDLPKEQNNSIWLFSIGIGIVLIIAAIYLYMRKK